MVKIKNMERIKIIKLSEASTDIENIIDYIKSIAVDFKIDRREAIELISMLENCHKKIIK